jgi:hypothetical protein
MGLLGFGLTAMGVLASAVADLEGWYVNAPGSLSDSELMFLLPPGLGAAIFVFGLYVVTPLLVFAYLD